MDIENLSRKQLISFFVKYFNKEDLEFYYFCRICRLLHKRTNGRDGGRETISETGLYIPQTITFYNMNFMCLDCYDKEKHSCFMAHRKKINNMVVIPNLSIEEIKKISYNHIYSDEYSKIFVCECKKITMMDYDQTKSINNFINEKIIINSKLYNIFCKICNKLYPECFIDKYMILAEVEENLCFKCYYEINPVNLKPAKV
jgi:hypothetical protein